MRKFTVIVFVLLFGAAFFACTSSIPYSDAKHQQWAAENLGHLDLAGARILYTESCSGCHTLHSPSERTKKEWGAVMSVMSVKARLTHGDSTAISGYLEAFSRDNRLSLR